MPPSSPSFFLSYSLLFQLIKIISYPAIYDKFLLVKNRKTPAALRRRGLLRLSTSIFRYNYILFPAVLSSISLRSISVGLWSEGLTDTEIAAQLGIPVVRFAKWRQRVGLLRPRTAQTRREDTTKKPAQAGGVQEEQSMKKQNVDAQETCRTAAPGAVTVKGLRVLLDAAEAAGYGDVPLEVKGCRFAEMHLRVETLIGAEAPGTLVELMATPAEA